ncbi:MAG: hypothetical protein R6X23_15225 [Acidimicrobiia bacterium]
MAVAQTAEAPFDLDDMFGIRRALGSLPPDRWDEFFATWAEIAEASGLDIEEMQALATLGASRPDGAPADGHLVGAWRTVSDAMGSYLLWRAQRNAATEFWSRRERSG